ncbi:hypothetical protein E8E12_004851 [Didymella heteroderae]|uniref:Uncharacterized protein n=1 Tax=Didymella heteroderae TaxID=1769908 RepID=A0A9P5BZP1_9PLEO|nr:hypothetical protein E8E12_004851 [Didymella heteroderae]
MRLEQQQPEIAPQQLATASEAEVRYNGEEYPFSRQVEIVDQVVDRRLSIPDLARRLGVEEQQARYPWEDFGDDIDSIVDTYSSDEEEEWPLETVCGEEEYHFDSVYYIYPKSTADSYRLDY